MEQQPFEEDLKVLAHLRGYAEDLRHYSNLIKQAHPRGSSALRLVLDRPAASASLIAAVCRYVAEGVPIASAVEAADLYGLPPARFLDEVASRPDFPAPLFAVDRRRLWRRSDLEAYRAQQPG
ncbi:MAG: hypothetical protein QN131_06335 [Armatimonadota bacterium]|nr:hypothetical protein [Armatimonadota bacterium]MDR7549542.1 hypothetical protein [Armatimonadota bacterium]